MKYLQNTVLLLLALLLPASAIAHDFEVDGIYYKKYEYGSQAIVTYRGEAYDSYSKEYSGDVVIPSSVTYDGVTYPVISIDDYAFYGCSGLTSITIANSVISINEFAFYGCSGLTSVNIPNSVTFIGNWVFTYCSNLTSITVASDNPKYDSRDNCNAIITSAYNKLIVGCNNTVIPNSVTSISECAFYGCSGLTSLSIPNSVTRIGWEAFFGCKGLTSLSIPSTVTEIEDGAFNDCGGLTSITVESGNSVYDSRNDCNAIIKTASNTLIAGCKNTVIPNTVVIIGDGAFYGCTGLASISVPNSVTEIGFSAFRNCTGLTSMTIPNSVSELGSHTFDGCSMLSSITLGESISAIEDYTFYKCSRLSSITIPNSVEHISWGAFQDCWNLSSVNIGSSVTYIGGYAFSGCSSIENITIPNSVTSFGEYVFEECYNLNSVTLGNSLRSISFGAFFGCTSLSNVAIPNSVTRIDDLAFSSCTGLINITIPSSVTTIGWNAFRACTGLKDITIPNSVTEIESDAFRDCTSLSEVTITSSVTTIENRAFLNCNSLNDVYSFIEDPSQMSMGNYVFFKSPEDYSERTLYVPLGSLESYQDEGNWSNYFGHIVEMGNRDNCLTVPDTTVFHGQTVVIPVKMTNAANIISFQTDIFLPEGLELLKENGEYLIEPTDSMASTHSIMSSSVANGSIRVLCYSTNYKPFTGNSGDVLFYLKAKVADDVEGDDMIWLKNTLLTTSDFEELEIPVVASNVQIRPYIQGDADASGKVTVTDVVVASLYVLERYPESFLFDAADMNKDGNITVTDVSRIAWMVLNPSQNAPLRAPALWNNGDRMSGESVTLAEGETHTVSIMLDNDMAYSGFQFDLNLPAGLTASNFRLTDRAGSHAFDVNMLNSGAIRALCYSPALESIGGHEGALLTFDVTAIGNVMGDIIVEGVELVTTACQTVLLDSFTIGVNNATSVNVVSASKTIARVDYYNLAGQQLDQPVNGVNIVVTTYTDGTRSTTKIYR